MRVVRRSASASVSASPSAGGGVRPRWFPTAVVATAAAAAVGATPVPVAVPVTVPITTWPVVALALISGMSRGWLIVRPNTGSTRLGGRRAFYGRGSSWSFSAALFAFRARSPNDANCYHPGRNSELRQLVMSMP